MNRRIVEAIVEQLNSTVNFDTTPALFGVCMRVTTISIQSVHFLQKCTLMHEQEYTRLTKDIFLYYNELHIFKISIFHYRCIRLYLLPIYTLNEVLIAMSFY